MTAPAWIALVLAAAAACWDWWAVARDRTNLEYVAKPLTLLALIAVAITIEPGDEGRRVLVVVALLFSLAGDVFLMLPRDLFLAGLASFLAGHLAYIAGFFAEGVDIVPLLVGGLVLCLLAWVLLAPVVRSLMTRRSRLVGPVLVYAAVITTMVAASLGYGHPVAVAGALSFYASDFLIARTRFVAAFRGDRVAIMTTYHVGQAMLVLSLL